jgi:hypothetical protein
MLRKPEDIKEVVEKEEPEETALEAVERAQAELDKQSKEPSVNSDESENENS